MNRHISRTVIVLLTLTFVILLAFRLYAQTPTPLQYVKIPDVLFDAAWSPDGKWLAVGGSTGVRVFDDTLQQVGQLDLVNALSISWKPDGTQLAVARYENRVRTAEIWNWDDSTHTFDLEVALPQAYGNQQLVTWSPAIENTKLAILATTSSEEFTGELGTVQIWNPENWLAPELTLTNQYAYPAETLAWNPFAAHTLAWSPSGNLIAGVGIEWCPEPELSTCDNLGGIAYIADATTGQRIQAISLWNDMPFGVAWSSDDRLAVGAEYAYIYNASGQKLAEWMLTSVNLSWSPDSRMLAGMDRYGSGDVVDTSSGNRISMFKTQDQVQTIAWQPYGNKLAVVRRTGDIELWDMSTLLPATPFTTDTP